MSRQLIPTKNSTFVFQVDISFNGIVQKVPCEISQECFPKPFNNPPTAEQWDIIEKKAREKFKDSKKSDRRLLKTTDFQ